MTDITSPSEKRIFLLLVDQRGADQVSQCYDHTHF